MSARPLDEAGWAKALAPVAPVIADMGDFLRAELAAGRRYLPAGANVLRAFQQPFDAVRVLIVGQDPYPTPGHAIGLSFSVSPQTRPLPRSLANKGFARAKRRTNEFDGLMDCWISGLLDLTLPEEWIPRVRFDGLLDS